MVLGKKQLYLSTINLFGSYLFIVFPLGCFHNIISTVENGGDHRDTDERGNSGSCSSLGEESNFVESQPYSPEIANESVLDGEVGKRLNQMVPVPVCVATL